MSFEETPALRYQKQNQIATLSIDNPARLNAMTFEMWKSLPDFLEQAKSDPEVGVLVLRGAGDKAFSSGADISQFGARRSTEEGVKLWNTTVSEGVAQLAAFPKPVVGLIRGFCFGGGVGLALHCDLRFVIDDASFSIPAARLGVGYYPMWLHRLSALVGPAVAKEIMFTARRYNSEQALAVGLINGIYNEDEALDIVRKISKLAPLSHTASKLAIDEAVIPGSYGLERCEQALSACFSSQDSIEGPAAFRDKRPAVFSGR